VPSRSDAVRFGAVALVPAIDPGLLGLSWRAGPVALLIALGAVAVLALLVAAAAYGHDTRRRSRTAVEDDSDLFTTTPLPMPKEELARMAAEPPPHHAFREHRLPRWVQVGSVVAALVITWVVAGRLRPPDGVARSDADSSASAASNSEPTASADPPPAIPVEASYDPDDGDGPTPFAFRALAWVVTGPASGCTGRLEVTRGTPTGWNLVARVLDDQGGLLDSARARVAGLREGEVVEFTFARATCDRIATWDVRGDRRR